MLTYRGTDAIDEAVEAAMEAEPLYDFQAKDYVRHTIWRMPDPRAVEHAFGEVDVLYVADGHHRSAAASRVAKELPDVEGAQYFMAVLFPMEEMEIMPYNRVIRRLP